jgi:hypothetical protein
MKNAKYMEVAGQFVFAQYHLSSGSGKAEAAHISRNGGTDNIQYVPVDGIQRLIDTEQKQTDPVPDMSRVATSKIFRKYLFISVRCSCVEQSGHRSASAKFRKASSLAQRRRQPVQPSLASRAYDARYGTISRLLLEKLVAFFYLYVAIK